MFDSLGGKVEPDAVIHQEDIGYIMKIDNFTVNLNLTVVHLVNETQTVTGFKDYLAEIIDEETVLNGTIHNFACVPKN